MKNSLTFALVILVSGACQRTQYATQVPAPKFEYFEEKAAATPTPIAQPVVEANPPAAEVLPIAKLTSEAPIRPETETTAAPLVSNEAKNTPHKLTFKQRILAKAVSHKVEKLQQKEKDSKTNVLSVIAAVAGLAGLILLFSAGAPIGVLLSLFALIGGFVGKSKIKNSNQRGRGWAIAAIVLGFITFFLLIMALLFILFILFIIALFNGV